MARRRPFRFGVQVSRASSRREWRAKCRRIEALGYTTMFVPDHFVDQELAPLPALAMAAAETERLRVCALVHGNDYKHPAVLAKEIATIDVLSDGRAGLGLGAGWMQSDYDALGLPYDSNPTRVDRLEEALAVVKGCWADGPFTFQGEHYRITDYDGTPRPVQQPRPRILVGGGGRRVLQIAAREADVVGINPNLRRGALTDDAVRSATEAATGEKVDWVREAAGERFDELELQIRFFLCGITKDARGVAGSMGEAFGLSADEVLASGVALLGTVDQVRDRLEEIRERWCVSNVVIGENEVGQFAPVVSRLAGR